MTGRPGGGDRGDGPARAPLGLGRFGIGSLLGLVAVLAGAVPFLALLLLVTRGWPPLQSLDEDVADDLNALVAPAPLLVRVLQVLTEGGGTGTAAYVLVLATACLLIRGQRRLAAYVAVTGLGLAVLVPVTKALVGRDRPVVALPVVDLPSNASFPSGHAMTSLVTWGVLLLVALPAVHRRWRGPLVAAVAAYVGLVGFTRLALGVHFVTDVLAGWALGLAWLAAVTAAFRGWHHEARGAPPTQALRADPPQALAPAPAGPAALPAGARTPAQLAAAWSALFLVLTGVGLLLTRALDATAVGRLDSLAVRALLGQRGEPLDTAVRTVNALAGTRAVVAVALALAVVALAVTASWRPPLFVALAVLGEVALYAAVSRVVGRPRPGVPDLTSGLPSGASYPSGHVAAATVVYGAAAVLVVVHSRSARRWAVLLLPALLVPAVAVGRVYVAAHRPSDVLAGALLGGLWLLAVTRALRLPATPAQSQGRSAGGGVGGQHAERRDPHDLGRRGREADPGGVEPAEHLA